MSRLGLIVTVAAFLAFGTYFGMKIQGEPCVPDWSRTHRRSFLDAGVRRLSTSPGGLNGRRRHGQTTRGATCIPSLFFAGAVRGLIGFPNDYSLGVSLAIPRSRLRTSRHVSTKY